MSFQQRNNVHCHDNGHYTMVLVHGYGCDRRKVIDNVGHCPHMSTPSTSAEVIDEYLMQFEREQCL